MEDVTEAWKPFQMILVDSEGLSVGAFLTELFGFFQPLQSFG